MLLVSKKRCSRVVDASSKAQPTVKKSCAGTNIAANKSKFLVDFKKKFFKDGKNYYAPSFFRCLAPGQADWTGKTLPMSNVFAL